MVTGQGSGTVVLVLDGGVEVPIRPLDDLGPPDLGLVDALARMQLVARRRGWSIRLRNPPAELCALLELAGLAEVVAEVAVDLAALSLEAGGETEGGEQLRVEEVVETGDPPA